MPGRLNFCDIHISVGRGLRRGGALILALALGSCFYIGKEQAEDVLQKPVTEWSSRDCLTVVLSSMRNNLFDQRSPNVKIIATPYSPPVIAALNRMGQMKEHWSDAEMQHHIDTALALQAGLLLDWQSNRLVDLRGNYLKSDEQLDVLQFLITLKNTSWPCAVPMVFGAPLLLSSDWPCYIPRIDDLDTRIFLENDRGVSLYPKHIWGRQRNLLTMEETLIVRFDLTGGEANFFRGTSNAYLVITGFDARIRLAFPLSAITPSLRRTAVN